jgi:AsmA protein
MKFKMKWYKIAIAGVVVLAALLVIFGIPANFLAGAVQSRLEAATGYRLGLGGVTTISLRPEPTISFRDVTLLTGNEENADSRFKAETIRVVLSLADLLHGHPRITQLTISRPTIRVPLPRERTRVSSVGPSPANSSAANGFPAIDHIVVEEGAVEFYSRSAHNEGRIDHIALDASLPPAIDVPTVTGSLYVGGQLLHIELKSNALPASVEGQAIPVELTLQGPAPFVQPLSARAELRLRNNSLAINSLSGRFGPSRFSGWATVDLSANKPMAKADLDFDRVQILAEAVRHDTDRSALSEPWSDRQFSFDALNFFDAEVRVSASDFTIGSFRLAPTAMQFSLDKGVIQGTLANTSLYAGTAEGTFSLDASRPVPAHAMHVRLAGVSALPLLSDVAGFESLEGTMRANIDVNASGASQKAAISTLAGTLDIQLANGAVRGIDVSKLMHNLTSTILDGWQQNPNDKTPLSDLNASFSLANGIATTTNLVLTGPIARVTGTGSIDIAEKTLQMKVDPRLIVGQQDAGGSGGGTGLGVPVLIQGNWSAPRIYPGVGGILNNPAAAFDQLKAAGKGLFGDNRQSGDAGPSGNANQSGGNNGTFDNLIGGFLKGTPGSGGGFFGGGR